MVHGKIKCPKCSSTFDIMLDEYKSSGGESQPQSSTGMDLGELLSAIDDSSLEGKNAEFVTQMRERYDQYGERTICSDKQRAWLEKLAR